MAVTITPDHRNSANLTIKVALGAGDTSEPIVVSRNTVVTGTPGSGGTIKAQATWSLPSEVAADAARWFDWDAGTSASAASQVLYNATAVRFIAATAAAVGEVAR